MTININLEKDTLQHKWKAVLYIKNGKMQEISLKNKGSLYCQTIFNV